MLSRKRISILLATAAGVTAVVYAITRRSAFNEPNFGSY